MKPAILYISYDGMLEPLGQSQVLAYLEKLSDDYAIRLISFEKRADWSDAVRRRIIQERLAASGVRWIPLRYHKAPAAAATAFDIGIGTLVAIYQILRHRIGVVHCRSYVAALIGLTVKQLTAAKLLFDMRGFWADERVDGGLWPSDGRLYRIAKSLERQYFQAADHVVTLTHASVSEIERFPYLEGRVPPITVIPTCVDLDHFKPPSSAASGPFLLGHVGSVGTWYLFDKTLAFFKLLLERRPDARMLVVNRDEHTLVRQRIAELGIDPGHVTILSADHRDVPGLIGKMTVGAAIIKPLYSKIASAPTKLAEYLACGKPCLGNSGVGDMETVIEGERVGMVLDSMSEAEMRLAVDRLLLLVEDPDLADRCVDACRRLFSLEGGAEAYRNVYRQLMGPR